MLNQLLLFFLKAERTQKKMLCYDLQNYWIEKLVEEQNELTDANILEGEDPDISGWLRERNKLIKKFDKKLRKAEDPEDYRQEVKENLIDSVCRLIFGE